MNIHEYQAKQLLAKFGVPVSKGIACKTADEVAAAFQTLGEPLAVVKAQIHAGGRGKAGGVKLVRSADEARKVAAGSARQDARHAPDRPRGPRRASDLRRGRQRHRRRRCTSRS
jgi:succinyl-CoA synthetase beta subunit